MDPNAINGQIQTLDAGYNPTDVYNKALSTLGVPDARTRVQALRTQMLNNENLLNNVEGSVTGRTSGSLVTEAQRSRLVATEKQPLAETEATLGKTYNDANTGLTDLLGQAQTESDLAGKSYSTKRQSLADQLAYAQKQKSDAESTRQFNVSEANKVATSKAAAAAKNPSAQDIIQYYVSAPSQYGAYNASTTNYHRWQAAEEALQQAGYAPGSAAMKKLTTAAFGSPAERKALGV